MFGNHGLCGLLKEGAHEKFPKGLSGNLGDFGEFCKGLILSDAVLIGEIPEGIDEIPDELKKFLVGRILESDILNDSVGYKYPTYG